MNSEHYRFQLEGCLFSDATQQMAQVEGPKSFRCIYVWAYRYPITINQIFERARTTTTKKTHIEPLLSLEFGFDDNNNLLIID